MSVDLILQHGGIVCLILLHRIFKTKMSKRGTLFDFAFTSGSAKKKPRINEDSQNEVGQPPELQNTQEVVVEVHRDPIVEPLEVKGVNSTDLP